MADKIPAVPADVEDVGPKKSFWGHLADLRTALIRSAVVIVVALVVCLLISPWIVKVLEEPMRRMHMFEKPKPTVSLLIGDTRLGPFEVTREQFPGLPPGGAPHVVFRVGTAPMGKEQVATLTLEPDPKGTDPLEVRLHNFSPAESFMDLDDQVRVLDDDLLPNVVQGHEDGLHPQHPFLQILVADGMALGFALFLRAAPCRRCCRPAEAT